MSSVFGIHFLPVSLLFVVYFLVFGIGCFDCFVVCCVVCVIGPFATSTTATTTTTAAQTTAIDSFKDEIPGSIGEDLNQGHFWDSLRFFGIL